MPEWKAGKHKGSLATLEVEESDRREEDRDLWGVVQCGSV